MDIAVQVNLTINTDSCKKTMLLMGLALLLQLTTRNKPARRRHQWLQMPKQKGEIDGAEAVDLQLGRPLRDWQSPIFLRPRYPLIMVSQREKN